MMQDILSTILLISIAFTSAITVYTFTSSLLADLFSSPETTFHVSLPLRIEKIYYQDANTCFIIRNPNPEPVDANTIAIYINGRLYNPSSDSNTIPPEGTCNLCVPYIPSGDEEVRISTGAGASAQTTIPEEIAPIKLYCNSCSDCTSKLQTALSWAEANDTTAVVYLTQDISASGTCISLSNLNFNGIVTFDGQGHMIAASGYTGINLYNTSGLTVKNLILTGFYRGIYLKRSSHNTFYNISSIGGKYGIYLFDYCKYNKFINVTVTNSNQYGMYFNWYSNSNTVTDSNISNNGVYGLYFYMSNYNSFNRLEVKNNKFMDIRPLPDSCDNTFANIVVSRNRPFYYCNSACELNGLKDTNLQDASLIILCDADGSKVEHVNVCGAYCAGGPKNNGILVMNSNYLVMNDVNSSFNYYGVVVNEATYSTFTNIKANNNEWYGLYLSSSRGTSVTNSQFINNSVYDVHVYVYSSTGCPSSFTNVTVSRNKPLYYCNSACELNGLKDTNLQDASLIILCDADGSKVEHVNVCGAYCAGGPKNNGILVFYTDNAEFNDVNSSYNYYGFFSRGITTTTFSNIKTSNNVWNGMYVYSLSNSTLTNIVARNNCESPGSNVCGGVFIYHPSKVTISSANLSENGFNGLCMNGGVEINILDVNAGGNARSGIDIWSLSNVLLSNIVVQNNGEDGIEISYSHDVNFDLSASDTHACNNGGDDLSVVSTNVSCVGCGSGYFLYYTDIYGSISCDCSSPCP